MVPILGDDPRGALPGRHVDHHWLLPSMLPLAIVSKARSEANCRGEGEFRDALEEAH